MKNVIFLGIIGTLFLTGCTIKTTPVQNKIDGTKVEFQKLSEYKSGTSCIVQGFFGTSGSDAISDAAKAGNIQTVMYVEQTNSKALFGDAKSCTTVYGK